MFYYFSINNLREQLQNHLLTAVEEINNILAFGEQSNKRALSLSFHDLSCDAEAADLRESVVSEPYVRATNLGYLGNIYCTSLWGPVSIDNPVSGYIKDSLLLMHKSLVSDTPLLVIRTEKNKRIAFSEIDGIYIQEVSLDPDLVNLSVQLSGPINSPPHLHDNIRIQFALFKLLLSTLFCSFKRTKQCALSQEPCYKLACVFLL
ncbi:hypothetical protein A3712_09310 [Vibrio sp. HI00D65]|uniref:CSS-motif domain-containing protein n=1 Tax=Vibrio sp. HI00D65 TaxID=1822216 RepID=UPI0007B79117|nr:CSS-motif domain-containing protein [Vibrio sp. HI00D65]KZX69953.1 hypothetical protein A3712_09310 [Vibrio sp. HI00D65]